jgi:hypothetical protein
VLRLLVPALVAVAGAAGAQMTVPPSSAPYAPDAPRLVLTPRPAPASAASTRSVVVDQAQAEAIEAARAPRYTERVDVIGRDRDTRKAPPKSLEQRFAESLNGQQGNGRLGGVLGALDTRPCMALASMVVDIGTAYNPYGFCP